MATHLLPEHFPVRPGSRVAAATTIAGYFGRVLVLAAACAIASYAGARAFGAGITAPIWPSIGVAIAGLLLLGARYWPGVTVGVFLGSVVLPGDLAVVVVGAFGSTLTSLLPVLVLPRLGWGDFRFERTWDVVRYVVVAGFLAPTLGALAMSGLFLLYTLADPLRVLASFYFAGVAGALLVGPLVLTWLGPAPSFSPSAQRSELLAMVGGLVVAALLTDWSWTFYFVTIFPLLAWAGLRTGPRGASLMSFALFLVCVWAVSDKLVTDPNSYAQRAFLGGITITQGITSLLLATMVIERRRANRDERTIEGAYRTLVAAAPFAVVGVDREGRVTVWSSAAERMFGWTAQEVAGRRLPIIPEHRTDESERLIANQAEGVNGLETVRRRKDGAELDISLTAWPVFDGEGRLSGVMEVHQDITERKRAGRLQQATYRVSEAALAALDLEQLYGAIHEIVAGLMSARNLSIALYDPDTDRLSFPYWSDERATQPGVRQAGKGLTEYVLRSGRPLRDLSGTISGLTARGEIEPFTTLATDWLGVPLKARGHTIGVLAVQSYETGACYTDRDQAILEFVSIQVGMAIERKGAEDRVRASERELRALFAAMRDVIQVLDQNGTYLRIAPTSPGLLPAPAAELLGRRLVDVHPPEVAARFLSLVRTTLASGQPSTIEYPLTIQGQEIWFSAVVSPLEANTVLWVARSINEQKQAEEALHRSEEQLRQAVKMEAVGRLAGGVAHDFNNLLTSVLGHADLALKRVPSSDPLHDDLVEIMSAGSRAAALTQQLLAFSRKQVLEPRIVDLNATVTTIARMLRRTIGEDIELETRLAPELGAVRADPVQMEQVILNLAVNARDAMPLGGQLLIETSNQELPGGAAIRVTVTDTGMGMSEEVRAHIFEPFFTTKEMGKGTGLGLATAYGIVKQSGGTISVTSSPGKGSTFLVDLPRVRGEAVTEERRPASLPGGGSETILLVEDEDAVRNLIRRVLELHGYKVLTAPSGEAALEVSRLHGGPLHLLLTDVVMPGISGPKLAERLLVERPSVRIVLMSGYAATTLEQKILLDPASSFLQKPFTSELLMRRVREVLDQVRH
ncbi:MAG TPA: PAS domain S-box protein [Gemmatimonadales bacterium]|nr:PAS domain S-box protein [Gemmatimonadales bacterium]